MMPWRSMASDMAWRTRTSLNGALSVRIEMWLIDVGRELQPSGGSGRFCLSVSLICTQSVRLIVPGNSQPRSYLPAEERGHARGIVLVDDDLDAVDVGQAGHEVARVAHQRQPDVRPVAVEHPGAGADDRLGLLEVAELLDALLGDDGAPPCGLASMSRNQANGSFSVNRTVYLSSASTLSTRREHVGVGVALDGAGSARRCTRRRRRSARARSPAAWRATARPGAA